MAAPEAPLWVGRRRRSWERQARYQSNVRVKNKEDTSAVEKDDAKETKTSKDDHETVVKSTRPQGRYKRRGRGKLFQAYSSKDLERILAEEFPATNCDQDVTSESAEALESNILVVEENVLKDIPPDWWGYKYGIVSGGLLGAQSRKKKSAPTEHAQNFHERTAFHQENLYNLVQNKATTGKQGLGIRDRPRKIAGCYFQGKNTSFDDSDGEDSADSSTSPKCKFDDTSEMDKRDEPKVKLKKLCSRQLLRQVPGESLKLKQLKALMDEQSSIFSNFSSRREALAFLKQKLEGCQKFAVEGKRVTLSFK